MGSKGKPPTAFLAAAVALGAAAFLGGLLLPEYDQFSEALFNEDEPSLPFSPCPETPDGQVVSPNQYTDVAPPYTGPGPHPVRIDSMGSAGVRASELPQDWTASPEEDDTQSLQLVVCEYDQVGAAVEECRYTNGDRAGMREATYTYHVREARTGELVGTFELEGIVERCPPYQLLTPGEELAETQLDPSAGEVIEALTPFVEGTV